MDGASGPRVDHSRVTQPSSTPHPAPATPREQALTARRTVRRVDRRESVVSELAQDVVGTAAEFACDGEAGAVVVEPLGDLAVVGVVGTATAGGALGRFEERPAQQRGALVGEAAGDPFLV